MTRRLRRVPVAVAVGALFALLDPNGRWLAAVFGALVVLFLPEVQPWLVAHLRRPGELTCWYRRLAGTWSTGTVKLLDAGVRWRADEDDVEPRELVLTADRFAFAGFTGERPGGLEAIELRTETGGTIELALPGDRADRVTARFRIARD
jgi:hypothetical protein